MDTSEKELRERIHEGLLNLIDKTLADPESGPDISKLMDKFRISKDELTKEVHAYTLGKGVDEYHNEHYQKLAARLTLHFHNLVSGTYHKKRFQIVLDFLRKAIPNQIIEVGYGTPASHLLNYLSENSNVQITLLDQDPSAEEFAKEIIANKDPEFLNRVKFRVYDMDSNEYPGDADVYIYLDSIEHTKDPTSYLKNLIDKSKDKSYFIFSLPICTMKGLENFHYAEWLQDEDARKWVKDAGLKVIDEDTVDPNPEVDFFADLTPGGYHNYLVLAQKQF